MERRKYKRLPIELKLEVDEVFKQDNIVIKNLNASVSVFDISRSGIGFLSEASLPLGYYFRGRINLGDHDFFDVVIQIVHAHLYEHTSPNEHSKVQDQGYIYNYAGSEEVNKVYGAQFVGLAPFLADKVDKYEKKLLSKEMEIL